MTDDVTFTDDELSAYLDGELDRARANQIEEAVTQNTALAARLDALRAGSDAFRAVFDDVLSQAPAMPALPANQSTPPTQWRLAAASLVAGAVLMFGGMQLFQPKPEAPGWKAVIANYQSLYVAETLTANATSPEAQAASLARLSERLGFEIRDLPQVEGLTFVRAQELGFRGRPLAQLTFLSEQDGPVALCIVHTGKATSAGIRQEELSGMDAYSWTEDGYGILLIGPKGETGLATAAETFRKALAPVDA